VVETTGRSVKVETEILRGRPAAILVSESEDAEMDCVGSTGIDRYSCALLCSTATEVAEKSHCPVMLVRPQQDLARQQINWISTRQQINWISTRQQINWISSGR
jgi:Universal stress protein family